MPRKSKVMSTNTTTPAPACREFLVCDQKAIVALAGRLTRYHKVGRTAYDVLRIAIDGRPIDPGKPIRPIRQS